MPNGQVLVVGGTGLADLRRAVKWGMAYYGVGGGWCFTSGAFVGHVKLMFIRGTDIKPEPPATPVGMGKSTRGIELASVDDPDERQAASWMKQAAAMPFFGGRSDDIGVRCRPQGKDKSSGAAIPSNPFWCSTASWYNALGRAIPARDRLGPCHGGGQSGD